LNRLEILTKNEIENIHYASLKVLETVGMVVGEETSLTLLAEAGANVDHKRKLAKIPQYLIHEMLKRIPKGGRTHYGRKPEYDVSTDEQTCFRGSSTAPYTYDIFTGEHRFATKKDLANTVRLIDGLSNIHICFQPYTISDVPKETISQHTAEAMLKNTQKPIGIAAFGLRGVRDVIKMAAIVAGGVEELIKRPIVEATCEPVSPLQLDKLQLEMLIEFAKHKLPIEIAAMPAVGSTAPMTLAGTLVQANAEHLCMILIAQLINPGNRVEVNAMPGIMDPRTGINAYGAIERMLVQVAMIQLYRSFYGIEAFASGGVSDSKVSDEQAGYERMANMLLPALAGAHGITGIGCLEAYLTTSPAQLVIDNEIAGMILRGLKGIEVNEETLALDAIRKVGPRGNFLREKHSLQHLRKELYIPELADRKTREEWQKIGAKDILQRAKEKAKQILETHEPEPLEKDIQEELRKIVKEAEKEALG
jgi:trimethylamine--corrinoid protein Co-methyltransferase